MDLLITVYVFISLFIIMTLTKEVSDKADEIEKLKSQIKEK